jgi:hypothetical protein
MQKTASILLKNPTDLVKVGNYLYITSYTDDSLTVVDVTNPLVPTFVTSIVKSATIRID